MNIEIPQSKCAQLDLNVTTSELIVTQVNINVTMVAAVALDISELNSFPKLDFQSKDEMIARGRPTPIFMYTNKKERKVYNLFKWTGTKE